MLTPGNLPPKMNRAASESGRNHIQYAGLETETAQIGVPHSHLPLLTSSLRSAVQGIGQAVERRQGEAGALQRRRGREPPGAGRGRRPGHGATLEQARLRQGGARRSTGDYFSSTFSDWFHLMTLLYSYAEISCGSSTLSLRRGHK
jgi:hypothetical protein